MVKPAFSFPRWDGGLGVDLGRLLVHLEHIAEAAELLRAGGVVRERMALVAADHLAEVLLQDHVDKTFVTTEQEGPLSSRRYDRHERRRLLGDFSARIELACATQPGFWPPPRLLDARDAVVFRVAHGYRNELYHGDQHNPALGRPLAVEYLQAVGRALVRSSREGLSEGSYSPRDPRVRAFRRLGASMSTSLTPRRIAEECVQHLVGRFHVKRATLSRQLIQDVDARAAAVQSTLGKLSGLGFSREIQREFIQATFLWAAYRADPDLVRLQDEHDALMRGAATKSDAELAEIAQTYAANEAAAQRRRDELSEGFRPPATISTATTIIRSARRLDAAPNTAALLERYQALDERLRLLEQCVARVDLEFDRMLERASDRARGK